MKLDVFPDQVRPGDTIVAGLSNGGVPMTVVIAFRTDHRDGTRCLGVVDPCGVRRDPFVGLGRLLTVERPETRAAALDNALDAALRAAVNPANEFGA